MNGRGVTPNRFEAVEDERVPISDERLPRLNRSRLAVLPPPQCACGRNYDHIERLIEAREFERALAPCRRRQGLCFGRRCAWAFATG